MNKSNLTSGFMLLAPEAGAELLSLDMGDIAARVSEIRGEHYDVDRDFWHPEIRPYKTSGGVLEIPVKGVLSADWKYSCWGLTGYSYIRSALDRGLADPDVKKIVLVVNSPGGMVSGCHDLAQHIRASRGKKPILALASDTAASAAYWIASAADRLYVTRTGAVGSVGVITTHVDHSTHLERMGFKPTAIFAGEQKNDGSADAPLSDRARKSIQARIDELYGIFCSEIALNRRVPEEAIRETQAAVYGAKSAIEIGLADEIATLDQVRGNALADSTVNTGDDDMTDTTAATTAEQETATAAPAGAEAAAAVVDPVKAAMERIGAILGSDEAKARPAYAQALATDVDLAGLSAEKIIGMLGKAPEEAKADAGVDFHALMDGTPNPEVGADAPSAKDSDPMMAAVMANFK